MNKPETGGITPDRRKQEQPLVLVVDDTEGNRYAVSHLLRAAGMRVVEATTGAEALREAEKKPDVIVLDINLPDISGREVLRQIRENSQISWIPVMHVSASYTGSDHHALGLDSGADAYLTHPLDPPVFLATTRALLRLSKAETKVRRASQEWRAAFDCLADAIFILGRGPGAHSPQRVQRCNLSASMLLGRPPSEIVGMLWSDVAVELGTRDELLAPLTDDSGELKAHDVKLGDRCYTVSTQFSREVEDSGGFNVCVLRDVTERNQAERDKEALVVRANEARLDAEAANLAKSDFLAIMSHELRTPLNAIAGYVDLLLMGIRGPLTEDQLSDLERIRRSQTSLTILINDVLNFAKVESGELTYHIANFPIITVLDNASELVEHQLPLRRLSFVRDTSDAEMIVSADADKVQQIVLNLLSNAIKFTPPGGTITLTSREQGGDVAILVKDTGEGIPKEMRDAIFEPFVQVHTSRTREHAGVGLGLAISRDLARGMGGELSLVESSPAGTTFMLCLESAAPPPAH
jgi:signal transduction histidine kinase